MSSFGIWRAIMCAAYQPSMTVVAISQPLWRKNVSDVCGPGCARSQSVLRIAFRQYAPSSLRRFKDVQEAQRHFLVRVPVARAKSIRPPCAPAAMLPGPKTTLGVPPRAKHGGIAKVMHARRSRLAGAPQKLTNQRQPGHPSPTEAHGASRTLETLASSSRAQQGGDFTAHARFGFARQRAAVRADDTAIRDDVRLRPAGNRSNADRRMSEQRMPPLAQLCRVVGLKTSTTRAIAWHGIRDRTAASPRGPPCRAFPPR